jgi:hypothetical protein
MTEELRKQLIDLGLTEEQIEKLVVEGLNEPSDMQLLSEQDLKEKTGAGLIVIKKVIAAFAPKVETPSTTMAFTATSDILPDVPSDKSWLEALCSGGVLKVEQSTVIAAIRAALASSLGLYELPNKLVIKMEGFAEENADPAPEDFFKIRKMLTRHNYAEIFAAIDGLDGNFVTEGRKKAFLTKVDDVLWTEINSFYLQLKSWVESWQQGAAGPAMMMSVLASFASGTKMPAGMMAPPDTGVLRDGAASLNDSINKIFAGVGVQISAALAYEASKIKEIIENPKLPSMLGAANRDQMLRMLGADVPATYPRLETNLTRFVLGILKIKDIAAGEEELQYFGSLYMLGSQIPWDKFDKGIGASLGKKKPNQL